MYMCIYLFCLFFETGSCFVVLAGVELTLDQASIGLRDPPSSAT